MWIGAFFGAILIAILVFLGYMGMLVTPAVYEKEMGPFTLVYEDFTGPYKETGRIFEKVYKNLKKDGIETRRGIGIYFDNPASVPEDQLRSQCGSIVEEGDLEKLETVKDKYNIQNIERKKSIVVDFPIRNTMSYMLAPMKAYPALAKYAEERKYEMLAPYELYDMESHVIHFVMPVE